MKTLLTRWIKFFFVPLSFLFVAAENDLVTFTIHNDSDYSIYYLYLSNSDSQDWGEDRLGDDVLESGGSYSTLVYPSNYDIKMIDEDDDVCVTNNVNIRNDIDWRFGNEELLDCQGYNSSSNASTSGTREAGAVKFTIRNNSDWTIYHVYMSAPEEDWGSDQLGSDVITSNGGTFSLYLQPGTYDLKLEDEDGDVCTSFGININSDLTWSYGNAEWLDCIE
ncbi:MAG: hypothetical protein EP346_05165 [Bacteroidetes bacterium]|nr:MAG: hypothetical protein EP346_05165 [Bacteroidota bacterium]